MNDKRSVYFSGFLIAAMLMSLTSIAEEFTIKRGVNISHWLSQSQRRGAERDAYFTEKDVAFIAKIGYDHIRLPIDEVQLFDDNGAKEPRAFELLHSALKWAQKHELRVIVDLHILRSHYFDADEKPLFTDPKAQETFFQLWRDLSAELSKYPTNQVAYELMNEPVADDHEIWNRLVDKAVKVIRENEPSRKIVIGSNKWQSPSTFDSLKIPQNDRNIILSFHFYEPMLVSHHQASWNEVGAYKGPLNYPGLLVSDDDLKSQPDEVAKMLQKKNGTYNRAMLEEKIQKALKVAKEHGLPLYCGEWGCIVNAPRAVRLNWYRDVHGMLEDNGVAWANWDYKGGFGIKSRGGVPDDELISILMGD